MKKLANSSGVLHRALRVRAALLRLQPIGKSPSHVGESGGFVRASIRPVAGR